MRLGIYAITKNEEKNVQRWLSAIKPELLPGDSITVVDTGSADDTSEEFVDSNVRWHEVSISPWRFDVARNAALALVPADADAAWALDLDEVPQPGWRALLEQSFIGTAWTRLRYEFVWNFLPDGSPGVVFYADKLHKRHGFTWKGIAHEWLEYEGEESHSFVPILSVHHHQDVAIERRNRDMELMARAIREEPNDPRVQHYYARQLFFSGRMVEAAEAFQVHLANPLSQWRHERSESMLYLARAGGNHPWEIQWLYRAIGECPERRETWIAAAKMEAREGNYALAISLLDRAATMPTYALYLSDPEVRDESLAKLRREWKLKILEETA